MKTGANAKALDVTAYLPASEQEAISLSGVDGLGKRAFDYITAASLLVFLAPLMLAVALLIKAQDGGPVLFRQKRCGRDGKAFNCLKFRSMKTDAEAVLQRMLAQDPAARSEWGSTQKLQKDPRITRLGRFLRKSSLDELPQLFNILAGDMSLIGPRPVTFGELPRYGSKVHYYYMARPGVTGLWQVNGRNRLTYQQRVDFDAAYVRDWSFARDLRIIVRTVPAVLFFDGAY